MANRKSASSPSSEGQTAPSGADGEDASVDLRRTKVVPAWIREAIETHLEIEQEDARQAGAVGFMHRALVNTAMPYKDPKTRIFERVNGSFRLAILAGYKGGIPYGIYPRLLMSWVSTEVVRTGSPELELGESLAGFLRDVLDLSRSGGKTGTSTRVAEQMKRLFGAQITAVDTGRPGQRGFKLRNMSVVNEMDLDEEEFERRLTAPSPETQGDGDEKSDEQALWTPQREQTGWKSRVLLTEYFFEEIRKSPVPIDLRAYKKLRGSPLSMDIYAWLTYRMSYLQRPSRVIRWEVLMAQFGSGYTGDRAVLDFKRNFLQALNAVLIVYPRVNVSVEDTGIVLRPSAPHVPKTGSQQTLAF